MAVHTITSKNINALAGTDYPEAWRVSETVRRLITLIEARIAHWVRYRSTVTELSRLSDRELLDIGLVRGQIAAVARASAGRQGA